MINAYINWKRGSESKHLFTARFDELERFIGLIKEIEFKKPGKLVVDLVEEDGVYIKHLENEVDLDTLFDINLEYAEDTDEYFDWERFFPRENQSKTTDDNVIL